MQLRTSQKQMSESFWTITLLTLSGGFQDAYTYFSRGKVFANAQTGNLVLMTARLVDGDFSGFFHYLFPVLSFCLGIVVAGEVHHHFKHSRFHWRQSILLVEIFLLFITPLIRLDPLANCLVSFSCAMQVQSFRKVHGFPFASTMCIGNLRNSVDHMLLYFQTHDQQEIRISSAYLRIIIFFIIGSGLGKIFCDWLGLQALWISCLLLFGALLIMFHDPKALSRQTVSQIDGEEDLLKREQ